MSKTEVLHTKFGNAKLSNNGYYKITSFKEGNSMKYFHRLIWEDFYGIKIPKGYEIHHKNGNKQDNCILNLELVKSKLHQSQHSKGKNNPMYGKTHTKEVREKIRNLKKGTNLSHETKLKISNNSNTSGFYRVQKHKSKEYKQGFFWEYQYYDETDKRRKSITGINVDVLKEKVLKKGLLWIILDKEKANRSLEESRKNMEIYYEQS